MKKETQTEVKKQRKRRSPEMIAELIFEAERKGNMAEICRREGIAPNLFYRWKSKFREAGIQALSDIRRGRKPKVDQEKADLKAELARMRTTICDQAVELQLIKKSGLSDSRDP